MPEIKRMSNQTGGDVFEFRHAPLLRSLAKHGKNWQLFFKTPLGLYDPQYRIDLKESGGTQKDRLNKISDPAPFHIQIAKIVGLSQTEFPSRILSARFRLRTDQNLTYLAAKLISVQTNEGWAEFDFSFTQNRSHCQRQ